MSSENIDNIQWFLRTDGKTVFGPVATSNLVLWAEQGRILCGHEVSSDRQNWQQAQTVPELGITWFFQDSSGHIKGPFNRVAAENLIKNGKIATDTQLVSIDAIWRQFTSADSTTHTPPAAPSSVVIAASAAQTTALQSTIAAANKELTVLKKEQAAMAEVRQEHAAMTDKLRERESALTALQAKHEEALKAVEEAAQGQIKAEQQGATMQAEIAALNERVVHVERTKESLVEQVDALSRQATELDEELQKSRADYSELLSFSNARESELQGEIEALARPQMPVERATAAVAADPGGAVAHLLAAEIKLFEQDLVEERESLAHIREWSAKRQEALQTRLNELVRIMAGGEAGRGGDKAVEGTGGRVRTIDATRLQAEMDTLQATHVEAMRLAEERAAALTKRNRELENESVRLRSQVVETDRLVRANEELTETLRRRDQEASQERKHREVERENFTATQQALLRRIEQLERDSENRDIKAEPAAAKPITRDNNGNRRVLAPWFSLKK